MVKNMITYRVTVEYDGERYTLPTVIRGVERYGVSGALFYCYSNHGYMGFPLRNIRSYRIVEEE